jgi:hypothetical protein
MAISQIWTILRASDAVEKTLAGWGASSASLTRRTQKPDEFTIKLDGTAFDTTEAFPYQSQITLKRNGVAWFVGVATKTPRMGRPNAESVGYTLEGPWWFLEHIAYQQGWTFLNSVVYQPDWQYYGITPPSGPAPQNVNITNLILNLGIDGIPITTGAQITDALNLAIAAGAPLQIGTIDPALVVPSQAARDLTCAEVIRRMLHWHPDVVTWFDYSFSPPKLHMRARANLGASSFSVAGKPATAIDVAARPDLVPPVVWLNYETSFQNNDQVQKYLFTDSYPASISQSQPGAIVMTINLTGPRTTYVKQYIKTAAIDANAINWWKERLPWLNDANITNLDYANNPGGAPNNPANGATVTAILADGSTAPGNNGTDPATQSSTSGATYGFYLIEGDVPNWLTGHSQMVEVALLINYDVVQGNDANGNPVVEHHTNELLLCKVMSTDLSTGWYEQLTGVYAGESVPTGVAQAYYTALSQMQYEGSFEITEQECGTVGGPYLGKVLNLTGGLGAWSSMNAEIFETTEDIATGETKLKFGPVGYLSPKDWIAWMRVNRWREIGNFAERQNGLITAGAQPIGGSGKHDRGGSGSKGPAQATTWAGPAAGGNPGTYAVAVKPTTLDPSVTSPSLTLPSGVTVQLTPVQVWDFTSNAMKTALMLTSQPYTPA